MKRGDTYFYKKRRYRNEKKILTVCVQLFLEQGYKQTTISQIVKKLALQEEAFRTYSPQKTLF